MAKKITKWEDCGREDLNMIPTMLSHGFILVFTLKDRQNDRMTCFNAPHDPVSFKMGNVSIQRNMNRKEDGNMYYGWMAIWPSGNSQRYDSLEIMLQTIYK